MYVLTYANDVHLFTPKFLAEAPNFKPLSHFTTVPMFVINYLLEISLGSPGDLSLPSPKFDPNAD